MPFGTNIDPLNKVVNWRYNSGDGGGTVLPRSRDVEVFAISRKMGLSGPIRLAARRVGPRIASEWTTVRLRRGRSLERRPHATESNCSALNGLGPGTC